MLKPRKDGSVFFMLLIWEPETVQARMFEQFGTAVKEPPVVKEMRL
jgi:hypothetical protein